jgi:hypothetical protein
MSALGTPDFSFVAHIRRLSAAGSVLYIRIGNSDISRLGLQHGQAIEIDLGRVRIAGVVKTSGGSPWLAPGPGSSNAAITEAIRSALLEHGADVSATVCSLGSGSKSSRAANISPAGTVAQMQSRPRGSDLIRISSKDGIECIRQYNSGSYRGRSNLALDRDAYNRFRNGPSHDLDQLVDQIAFVGKEYGGAQERFGDIREEAALIATNLHGVLGPWLKALMGTRPLVEEVPNETTLDFLFSPFRGTKQWPVWASKTLHFLRPDAFPILDSNAKKPLRLRNLVNSSRGYHQFSSCFREVLLANSEALAAVRTADADESPTDLKVLDKILFQIGIHMN